MLIAPAGEDPGAGVLALQRALLNLATRPDPGPMVEDPEAFAREQGLPPRDQEAFLRFRDPLLIYRGFVQQRLSGPVLEAFPITVAFLEREGAWDLCLGSFLASRFVRGPFYREVAPAFLAWLAGTGWGLQRWPWLLQLAHRELLHTLVERHPGGSLPGDLHGEPRMEDCVVLDPAAQAVTYGFAVHLATPERPEPAPGTVHLLAYRDRQGSAAWMELTPATACLLVEARSRSIQDAALGIGLRGEEEILGLLANLSAAGAIAGFRKAGIPCSSSPQASQAPCPREPPG